MFLHGNYRLLYKHVRDTHIQHCRRIANSFATDLCSLLESRCASVIPMFTNVTRGCINTYASTNTWLSSALGATSCTSLGQFIRHGPQVLSFLISHQYLTRVVEIYSKRFWFEKGDKVLSRPVDFVLLWKMATISWMRRTVCSYFT